MVHSAPALHRALRATGPSAGPRTEAPIEPQTEPPGQPQPLRRPRTRRRGRTDTLLTGFDPARNALGDLRLGLALVVLLAHTLQIGFDRQPGLGGTAAGSLAVDAFFVLSGFLVARSYLRLRSPFRFAWHRFLRIMPAFWVVLLLSALVLAPVHAVLAGRPAAEVFSGPQHALDYVTQNLFLYIGQFDIAALPESGHQGDVVNGSLWTLFYEALCYLAVAMIGALGLLRRRLWAVTGATLLCWVTVLAQQLGVLPDPSVTTHAVPRFGLLFLLGVLGLLFADRVPLRPALAAAAAAVLLVACLLPSGHHALGAVPLAYLTLWAMARLPGRRPGRDLSYGVYLWHWPVAHLLTALGLAGLGASGLVAATAAITLLVAWGSWGLVESPALALKDLGRRRSGRPPGPRVALPLPAR